MHLFGSAMKNFSMMFRNILFILINKIPDPYYRLGL